MNARVPVAVLAAVVALAGALAYALRKPPPVHDAAPDASKPMVDSPDHCAAIRDQYRAELAKIQTCTNDDECIAERRDGLRSGLDGCARYLRHDAKPQAADAIASTWLDRGCSTTFRTCREQRAKCEAGRCTELPPEPVPRSWRRVAHETWNHYPLFSFFIPPDAAEVKVMGEDSEVGLFQATHYRIGYDYGYGVNLRGSSLDGDVVLKSEPFLVGDVKGEFTTTRLQSGRVVSGVTIEALPNTISTRETRLTLYLDCENEKVCADARIIAKSLELH